jgi:hypothetical protein
VATGPKKLENGLLKQQRSYAVDCLHTLGHMESSVKRYVELASTDSAVLRLRQSLSAFGL